MIVYTVLQKKKITWSIVVVCLIIRRKKLILIKTKTENNFGETFRTG